jgi:hypothetical protein
MTLNEVLDMLYGFSDISHSFQKDIAPDPPSRPLNVLPSSIRFPDKLKDYHIMRPLYP